MPYTPPIEEVIDDAIESRVGELYVAIPGKVQATHGSPLSSVDVIPQVRFPIQKLDGTTKNEDLPVIPNCPIVWPGGGGCQLTFPIQAGCFGLLLVMTYSISSWLDTAQASNPGDVRPNHIGNAVFLPGFQPHTATPQYAGDADVVLEGGSAPHIRLYGAASDFVTLATKVVSRLNRIENALSVWSYQPGTAPAVTPFSALTASGVSDVAATKVKAL